MHRSGLSFALLSAGLLACGSVVVSPSAGSSGAGGGDAGTTSQHHAASGPTGAGGGGPDAAPDASAICDAPSICSFVIDRGPGCIGATAAGDFCDFLATACSLTPPDCASLPAVDGVTATLGDCGDGTSFCFYDWTGTVSQSTLAAFCTVRDAAGEPVDCAQD